MYLTYSLLILSGLLMSNPSFDSDANATTATLQQQQNISISTNEGAAMKTLRSLLEAELKFQATVGKGEYGDLKSLHEAGLIDAVLASGKKSGYQFKITTRKTTLTSAPAVDLEARPLKFGKPDRRSFYLTESGVLLTSEEKDAPLNAMQPFAKGGVATTSPVAAQNDEQTVASSEDETAADVSDNEKQVISALIAIHSAEAAFITKAGAGSYGTLEQLEKNRLIDRTKSSNSLYGYNIELNIVPAKSETPASFTISAMPQTYGSTGRRSFFIDQTGSLRGADKEGGPADATDPVIK